jgi:transposase
MRQKSGPEKQPAEEAIKDIRRATRRHFSAEEKIRVVLEGLPGEESIAELCRREGIASSMYYGWSKEFLEAGKRRLAGDTARAATSDEVKDLRREAQALKEVMADLTLENRLLKKSMIGDGGPSFTDRGCCRIMAHRTSRRISRSGWISRKWSTFAAPPITHRPRAKSSVWHQTLKNRILLEHYYLPGDLER